MQPATYEIILATSDRLYLREFNGADIDSFYQLMSCPQVMKYSITGPMSRVLCQETLQKIIAGYKAKGFDKWAVCERESDKFVGCCGVMEILVDNKGEHEIGYRLLRQEWGKGYGTEAASLVKNFATHLIQTDSFISIIEPDNKASIRVAEKNMMTFEKNTVLWDIPVRIYRVRV